MSRRRAQRSGHLYETHGSWRLRWREDVRAADGEIRRALFSRTIGPAAGAGKLSRRQAERVAWEEVLSKLDQVSLHPRSMMTLSEFIRRRFEPEWVFMLKPAGKKHYHYLLARIVKEMGELQLRQITSEEVQALVRGVLTGGASVQTARHYRNAVSAIFRHAHNLGFVAGDNPAAAVRLPPASPKESHALTPEQAQRVMAALVAPAAEMAALALATSMNIAELAGLRWGRVNLTPAPTLSGTTLLPPRSLLVAEHFYRGDFGSLKAGRRYRILPLNSLALATLEHLRGRPRWTTAEDLVFVNRQGGPINEQNLRRRQLHAAGERAELPFRLTWHVLRRTTATWMELVSMPLSQRMLVMGHGQAGMTLHYTRPDVEMLREGLERLSALALPPATEALQ